jgi:serine/threonine protein kinase/tetratricopeptide (TPR) repeat protein
VRDSVRGVALAIDRSARPPAGFIMTEETIFTEALAIDDPAKRAAFLDRACGGDAALRGRLDRLLDRHREAGSFLGGAAELPPSAAGPTAALATDRPAGSTIGPYRLIEPIGEGGMGAVWMAQQTEPVRRLVALKLIKPGMDSQQVIARFEAERQALALMDHPNIAKVLDGGTTGAGRPYFVMDLVKGVPITKYCDEHRLTPRQRLELFLPVCQAVQHAHQKGVIHRDLKPSNVLVALYDGRPVPKVIDFGVAKAAGQSLTEKTLVTGFGAIVGTPEYMSPEQAEFNQLDIDTRSDIYSLGVLLYELLTGSPPFSRKELEQAGLLEMLRVIREQEPSKPSTKLSTAEGLPTLAANRGTEPAKLTRLVRGELDWIVMKALEKDRNRRYETANGFAQDVQRYLADEPVLACPPSAGYRLRKFARRNRAALMTAGIIVAAVVTVGGAAGWMVRDREARKAELARDRAARQERSEERLRNLLRDAAVLLERGKWPDASGPLKLAEGLLAETEASDDLRRQLGDLQSDLAVAQRLESIHRDIWDNDEKARMNWVAECIKAFRDYGLDIERLEAAEVARRVRARPVRLELVLVLDEWATERVRVGEADADGKDRLLEKLIEAARLADPDPVRNRIRDALPTMDRAVIEELANNVTIRDLPVSTVRCLAQALHMAGSDKGLAVLREGLRHHPDDLLLNLALMSSRDDGLRCTAVALALRPRDAQLHCAAGKQWELKGNYEEALAAYSKAIELNPRASYYRASLYSRLKLHDKAVADYSKLIELERDQPDSSNRLRDHLVSRGIGYYRGKHYDKAIADFSRSIELEPGNTTAFSWRADCHLALKQWDKALADWQKEDRWMRTSGPVAAPYWNMLGVLQYRTGDWRGAIASLRKGADLAQGSDRRVPVIPQHASVELAFNPLYMAMAHQRLGDQDRARKWYTLGLVALARRSSPADEERLALRAEAAALLGLPEGLAPDQEQLKFDDVKYFTLILEVDPEAIWAYQYRGNAHAAQRQYDKAVADYSKAIEQYPDNPEGWTERGRVYGVLGQHDKALSDYSRAVELTKSKSVELPGSKSVPGYGPLYFRGITYFRLKEYDKAIADISEQITSEPRLPAAWYYRGHCYRALKQWDKAIADYSKAIELAPSGPEGTASLNDVAWFLTSCPEPRFRNPVRAVALANQAVERNPGRGEYWSTLGAARYRVGDWQGAVTALQKSMALLKDGEVEALFFLAMAHWKLGNKDEASKRYGGAVAWMDKNKPVGEGLLRLREEAARLLGLPGGPEVAPAPREKK